MDSDLAFVTVLHDQHMTVTPADQPVYVHAVDTVTGRVAVYKVSKTLHILPTPVRLSYFIFSFLLLDFK